MNKNLPYILLAIIAIAFIALFVTGNNKKNRKLDSKVTFRKNDKRPYGMYVAYESIGQLFPNVSKSVNSYEPGYWDSLSSYEKNQALIIVADRFAADESELEKLIKYVAYGNDLFITARELSYDAKNVFNCKTTTNNQFFYQNENYLYDSLSVSLTIPPLNERLHFVYPGRGLSASFTEYDSSMTTVLGSGDDGDPDFIHIQAGNGNIYIHLAPIAFSNYFLLHKNNIRYFEKAFSLINPSVRTIVWDEYYLNNNSRKNKNEDKKGWLSVLLEYPGLKAALLTALLALLVFVLLEMRRKQRYIPVVVKPKNDSLDFVKTIGRLYYDKGNHQNLCKKMTSFFLEHVRNKYKLLTGNLDESFINSLKYKSGVDESDIRSIVSFIKYIDTGHGVTAKQVTEFHSQLESFYKNA